MNLSFDPIVAVVVAAIGAFAASRPVVAFPDRARPQRFSDVARRAAGTPATELSGR